MKKPQISQQQFHECLDELGITQEEMRAPLEGGPEALQGLKKRIKSAWRKKLPELHPDTGGSEERFKLFQVFLEAVDELKIAPGPATRRERVQRNRGPLGYPVAVSFDEFLSMFGGGRPIVFEGVKTSRKWTADVHPIKDFDEKLERMRRKGQVEFDRDFTSAINRMHEKFARKARKRPTDPDDEAA